MATEPHFGGSVEQVEQGVGTGERVRSIKVEFAQDRKGRFPGREWLSTRPPQMRERYTRLFDALKREGFLSSDQKFKKIGGDGLFEIKGDHQHRMLGAFREGGVFLVSHGFYKNAWQIPRTELERALRILRHHDELVRSREFVDQRTPIRKGGDQLITDRDVAAATGSFLPMVPKPEMEVTLHAWALVPQAQLLPKDAPLNLTFSPWRKWVVDVRELKPYLVDRMNALSPEARIAMGLVEPELDPKFVLGALWGTEYLVTRPFPKEERQEAVEAALLPPETTKADFDEPVADVVPTELPIAAEGRPIDSNEFPWFCRVGKGRKRYITAIVGRLANPKKSWKTGTRDDKLVAVSLGGVYGVKGIKPYWRGPMPWRPAELERYRHPLQPGDAEKIRPMLPSLTVKGKKLVTPLPSFAAPPPPTPPTPDEGIVLLPAGWGESPMPPEVAAWGERFEAFMKKHEPVAPEPEPEPVKPEPVKAAPPVTNGEFPKFFRQAQGPRRHLVAVVGHVRRYGKSPERVLVQTYFHGQKKHGWCKPVKVAWEKLKKSSMPLPPEHPEVIAAARELKVTVH